MQHYDIIWLAGFMDGEGTFGIYKHHKTYTPSISVCNSSSFTMMHIRDMFIAMNISAHFSIDQRRRKAFGDKTLYGLTIRDRESVIKLVNALVNYLYTKKVQALLILKWFEIQHKGSRLTKEGEQIALEVKSENH